MTVGGKKGSGAGINIRGHQSIKAEKKDKFLHGLPLHFVLESFFLI
jgi:hypothetical protein